ncbi:ribosomal protein S18 acetylase RimI-like enzyme [Paucibacter oligotrophus]|uniref:Ribosomal protein S18 acetylase RimI-like enzyme n=1 Tax=Roseateles oligotrophus TaxID=1769250 RepID=A0A840LD07_9BURK|nr:GNAT family N-acetyltransferase [Roseateles oligotrophus]MBB4846050.1 ribosomal protein S18 acetylase RimI-like enzyme [Roseateles oligotrophus]
MDEALAQLAQRAEAAGLNASAPPQQGEIAGWSLRLSPGKAKRSRCVNALAQGSLPLDELLARCQASFDAAGLPLILRLTPFSQPADLDAQLAAKGWPAFDAADVMVLADLQAFAAPAPLPEGQVLLAVDAARYAAAVGALRGSSERAIAAHAERLAASQVPYQGFFLQDAAGQLLACGQIAQEGAITGLYDVFTPPPYRGQGHGQNLCAALLHQAVRQAAQEAYLQVGSDNAVAQRLYRHLGFQFAYRYHYRSPHGIVD